MRFAAFIFAAFDAPIVLVPLPACADIQYPWCAVYGGNMGGVSN